MKCGQDHPKEPKTSARIERLLSITHPPYQELLSSLDASNLQALQRIASGEIQHNYRIKAIGAIAHVGGVEECKILGKIVADEKEEIYLRTVAAANLSLLITRDAEAELVKNLKIEEDLIRVEVIKSLGCVGGKKALKALDKISGIRSDIIWKHLTFAKALISYRLGLSREELPFVEGAKRSLGARNDAIRFIIKQSTRNKLRNCLQSLGSSNYGIETSENIGFEVECSGRINLMFLLNKRYNDNLLSSITEKKALFGLLVRRFKKMSTYVVNYLVLTSPSDPATLNIMICRTDGEVLFSGRGHIKDSIMNFSITDIERLGINPTQISGRLTNKGLEFQECYSLSFHGKNHIPKLIKIVETDRGYH